MTEFESNVSDFPDRDCDTCRPSSLSTNRDYVKLAEAFDSMSAIWADAYPASLGTLEDDLEAGAESDLFAMFDAVSILQRQLSATLAVIAREAAVRSRTELCEERLTFKYGSRSPESLIAERMQIEVRDAKALVKVGRAIIGDRGLTGERVPPKCEAVSESLRRGDLGIAPANEIVSLVRRMELRPKVDPKALTDGVEILVDTAVDGMPMPDFRVAVSRLEDYLDPDGLEPTIEEQRRNRSLTFRRDNGTGMTYIRGKFDTESAAFIGKAFEAYVTQQLRKSRGFNQRDAEGEFGTEGESAAQPGSEPQDLGAAPIVAFRPTDDLSIHNRERVEYERRSIPQIQADALVDFAKHILGCDMSELPQPSTNLIVRMDVEDLIPQEAADEAPTDPKRPAPPESSGTGNVTGTRVATIDGFGVIDVGTARKMAASAGIIPCVLDSDSVTLDLGREIRPFSFYQRLALVERDGGCAFCGLPPGMTEAHHLKYWKKHNGRTDLDNGILLCTSCHHRVHADWEIVITHAPGSPPRTKGRGGTVWFIPPVSVDPSQEPRLGGRKRFDLSYRLANPPTPIQGCESTSWVSHDARLDLAS